jgi:hypothetical protein
MNTRKEELIDTLEQALRRAYELREAPHFSRQWADGVVRDIRRQPSQEASFSEVPHAIWRAASVIAVVSTLFVGSVLTWTASQDDADFSALLTMATADSILFTGEP